MNHDGFKSRKFWFSATAFIAATVGLFTAHLDGNQWITAVTLVLGMYSAANVTEKRQ